MQYVTVRLHIMLPQTIPVSPQDLPVFAAIADPTRRAILQRLADGDLAAGHIAAAFPISRPAVSKHLRILRQAALVQEERCGRRRIYRLNPEPLRQVDRWLEQYRAFWLEDLASVQRHVEPEPKEGY